MSVFVEAWTQGFNVAMGTTCTPSSRMQAAVDPVSTIKKLVLSSLAAMMQQQIPALSTRKIRKTAAYTRYGPL